MSNDNDIRSLIIIEADQRSASEASRQLAQIKKDLIDLQSAGNIELSETWQSTRQSVALLTSSMAELNQELVQFGALEPSSTKWQEEIEALKELERTVADIKAQGGSFEFTGSSTFQSRLEEFEEIKAAIQSIKEASQVEFVVSGNITEQLEYVEQFQRFLDLINDGPVTAIQTDVTSVIEAVEVVEVLNDSITSLTDTQGTILALTSSMADLNQEMQQGDNDHNRTYWAEQIAYLEQFQDATSQVIMPVEELSQSIADVAQTTASMVSESTQSFSEFTAKLQEAKEAGQDIDASFFTHSDYYAEQIAYLQQFQNTTEELVPSVQEVSEALNEVATNVEAIRVPREDIFGPYVDSAQKLAEETRKASEEAKKLGADQASQENIGVDKRSSEALKTIEATTKALNELRKANIISKDAWNDASSSAWELYGALNDIAKEIQILDQVEVDLHDTGRVTQHRNELLRLQSTYTSLKEILGDLPKELIEGLQEAARENEQLAQQLGKISQTQTPSVGSLRGNISTISTLSNRVGLGSSGDFRVAGDIIELIDSLPDLKESLQGIPASIGAAVSAIGTPMGLGMLGAFGALAIGINHLTASAEAGRQAMKDFFDEQEQLIRLLRTGDSISILDQLAGLQEERDTLFENQQYVFSNADKISQALEERFGVATNLIYGLSSLGLGMGFENIPGLASEVTGSISEVNDADAEIKRLVIALEDTEVQTRGLERAISEAESRSIEGNQTYLNQTARELSSLRELTGVFEETSIQARLVAASIGVLEDAYYAVEQVLNDQTLERGVLEFADTMERRSARYAHLQIASADTLESRIKEIETQRQSINAGLSRLEDSGLVTEAVTKQIELYQDQLREFDIELRWINDGLLEQARERELVAEMEKEMVDAVIKYNRDSQAIRDEHDRAVLASEQKLTDDLVRIEDRRVQQIERAQQQLIEREQAINLKASRDEQDQAMKLAQERQQQAVKIEREELKAELDHARKVRDIREKSAQQEFNLLLKRDFAGLFALRQRTDQEIKTAERASDEATKAREQARGEQAQDEAMRLAYEREQRQTRYQREIADAHAQAQRTQQQAQATADRELQIARDNHNQQLKDLQEAKWRELGILKKGIHDEIAEIQRGSVSRVRAEMQTQAALMQAQQIGMINRMNAAYQSSVYQLPVGYTGKNSVVNNVSNANSFTINGNNVREIQRVVMDVMEKVWGR